MASPFSPDSGRSTGLGRSTGSGGSAPGEAATSRRSTTRQQEAGAASRADRLRAVLVRDGDRCVWCGRVFSGLVQPTSDHLVPKVKGGPSWIENEVAACRRCNGERGHQAPVDWLAECERRGWSPNRAALQAAMQDLGLAIEVRGGQRRAARYLDSQWRRWSRR